MKRDHLAFLIGGLAFGILIGVGAYHAMHTAPGLEPSTAEQAGAADPPAPGRMGDPNAGGGAPMVARINQLKRMLQEAPRDLTVLAELANMHYDAAMWEPAAGYYERIVELRPDPNVLTDLGVCYRGMREYDRALASFSRAQELDPTHWQSLYNTVVVAAVDIDDFDLASRALESMAAIEPRPAELDEARLEQLRGLIAQRADLVKERS